MYIILKSFLLEKSRSNFIASDTIGTIRLKKLIQLTLIFLLKQRINCTLFCLSSIWGFVIKVI